MYFVHIINYKKKTMKKLFTFFSTISIIASFAGTPTIDGVYSASEGWGTTIATGNGVVGWSDANAKKLYMTFDNNYVYLGAECSAQSWQQFIFALNNKSGGSSTDSWGRQINYNHTNKPDFLFRGDIAGGNYAEYHVWNGTSWTGTGVNVNASGTEVKGVFSATAPYDGFLEIRIPRSLIGFGLLCDVQFIIGGNANDHGCFDAIPNDNNSSGWNPPASTTNLTQYVSNVAMPATLGQFNGDVKANTANLNWTSISENNLSHYEIEQSVNSINFNKIGNISAKGSNQMYNFSTSIQQNTWYRLKFVDKDGSFSYCNAVLLKTAVKNTIEVLGNPVKDVVKFSVDNDKATNYIVELFSADGKKIASKTYAHPGGVTTMNMNAPAMKGLYYVRFTNGFTTDVLKIKVD
jgi:hypothetical protein